MDFGYLKQWIDKAEFLAWAREFADMESDCCFRYPKCEFTAIWIQRKKKNQERPGITMDGILNVYKEKGYTSHDVVAKLRGILKQKKIGHTGTLDPDAEGVLPVCLGSATKVCDLLTDKDKTYVAVLLLGQETDTQDTSGTVLHQAEVQANAAEVESCIMSFVGEYDQIPPMYSALKVNGKKLYELAREGKVIEREARRVQIHSIRILEINLPRVRMEVTCSKGTYIRTLCHDIGQKLGCYGCMEKLLRTSVSVFKLSQAATLAAIEAWRDGGEVEKHLIQVPDLFPDYPRIQVKEAASYLVYNGNPVSGWDLQSQLPKEQQTFLLYDHAGQFIGIFRWNPEKRKYFPEKMFYQKA